MNKRFAIFIVGAMVLGVAVGWAINQTMDAAGAKSAMQHHLHDCEERMGEPDKAPAADPWLAFSVKR